MRFANSEFPATECGLEFWNTLTTQASLLLHKPIYDLDSHTLHSTIKFKLLVIVTREHTTMKQAYTNTVIFSYLHPLLLVPAQCPVKITTL